LTFFNGGGNSKAQKRARSSVALFAGFSLAAGALTLAFLPSPYVIERPGPTYNVLGELDGNPVINISGASSFETSGRLDVLTVSLLGRPERTPGWLEIALAWLDRSQKVVPLEVQYPPGKTSEQVRAESSAMMEVSQQDAIAAALSELGYEFSREIYVAEVTASAAASGILVAADFILEVNGQRLSSIDQLRDLVASANGESIELRVSRDGQILTKSITPIKDSEGNYRIGVLVGYKYDFPVQIDIQLGEVGGPSGGMMFALGVIDRMTPGELTGGMHVAGTGTIVETGEVGPIGGVVQKLYGARRAGATVFLAPSANCKEIIGNVPEGLRVVKIETLKDAISALEKLSKDSSANVPTCN
jgi:Lon-like protease